MKNVNQGHALEPRADGQFADGENLRYLDLFIPFHCRTRGSSIRCNIAIGLASGGGGVFGYHLQPAKVTGQMRNPS
jgi:hypothetical protein